MNTSTEKPVNSTALRAMLDKLDNKRPDTSGYVTNGKELKAILNELTERIPVGVTLNKSPYPDDNGDFYSITFKVGIGISRSELDEADQIDQ